jgi:hypothetical protein
MSRNVIFVLMYDRHKVSDHVLNISQHFTAESSQLLPMTVSCAWLAGSQIWLTANDLHCPLYIPSARTTQKTHHVVSLSPLLCDFTANAKVCLSRRSLRTGCIISFYCCVHVLLRNGCFRGSSIMIGTILNRYGSSSVSEQISAILVFLSALLAATGLCFEIP